MGQKTKVITTTSNLEKCYQLERSLKYFCWDYHFILHKWNGFLDKIHETYKYLLTLKEQGYTHYIYTDAWDTFVLRNSEGLIVPDGLFISAEKACYPHTDKASLYPENKSLWKYVNGGGWAGDIQTFIDVYEAHPPTNELNDQVWLTDIFLKGIGQLDYNCDLFQTMAFYNESEITLYDGLLTNRITNTIPYFIHGNGHTPIPFIYNLLPMADTFEQSVAAWADIEAVHRQINETFADKVNATPKLKDYRDWIESKIFGFGERSFLWMWKLLIDTQKKDFSFLEIGVFRGQVLGLVRMLAPKADITGITPLDNSDNHWDSDYEADIKLLHDTFKLKQPKIIKGLSTDAAVIEQASKQLYDIIYIDGGHTYEVAKSDVYIYSSFVKVGGYLVIDDCSHKYKLPSGYFKGIESVSRAVDELLPNEFYKEVFSVVHNRVFKRL